MKKIIVLIALTLAFISCKETSKEVHDNKEVSEQVEVTEKPSENADWIMLFDGTSLENWRGYLQDDIYPEWTIEDGALAFTPGKEGHMDIITKDTFTNFILSLEWKISEAGNSGIFFGVHEDESLGEPWKTGREIQVLDNEKHPDAKIGAGTHTAAALYDLIAPPKDATKPVGEWNTCVIEVDHTANLAKVSLNDIELYTFPLSGKEWDDMVANSKFKDYPYGKYKTGHISLQDHDDKVWYRNIKIKRLPD